MSEINSQQDATTQEASIEKAQTIENTVPEEKSPKQVTYEDFMQQLQQIEKQIMETSASEDDLEALKKKVADLEDQVAKRAAKKRSSKKASGGSKELEPQPKDETGNKSENDQTVQAENISGKRLVAVDEIQRGDIRKEDWFKDILKAHKKLVGFRG